MRALAMADLHGFPDVYRGLVRLVAELSPDLVVLAGDLLRIHRGFPTLEEGFRSCAREMSETLDAVPCPVLYVMGNDDMVEWDPPQERFRSVHGRRIEHPPVNLVGYQYSLPFMGGIFEKPDDEIAADLAGLEHLVDEHTLLVTHAPAWSAVDETAEWPAGSKGIADLIRRRQPLLHVHGHIHSYFGRNGIHFNVSAGDGRIRGMLIDLDDLSHEVVGDV